MKHTIRYYMLPLLLLAAGTAMGKTPDWQWAVQAGGATTDQGKHAAADPSGNVFITGTFNDSAHFGDTRLISAGLADAVVARLSPQGTWLWAYAIGGDTYDGAGDVVCDAMGNVYVLATVVGDSVRCGSADGTISLALHGDADVVLVKYDSQGHLLWVRALGSAEHDGGTAMALGPDGTVHITGDFTGTMEMSGKSITSAGKADAFVAGFSPDGTLMELLSGGGGGEDHSQDISVDGAGNLYIIGDFANSATFGDRTLTGSARLFVVSYTPAGTVAWALAEGGDSYRGFQPGIAVAGNGDCYITGSFLGKITFSGTTLTSQGESDGYVVKYNNSGQMQWNRQIGGSVIQSVSDIVVDARNDVYITGGSQNLSPGALFVRAYDAAGTQLWQQRDMGGTILHSATQGGVTVDASGNVYMVASFSGPITFGSTVLTSIGSSPNSSPGTDIVVAKLGTLASVEHDAARAAARLAMVTRAGETIFVDAVLEHAGHAVITLYDARGALLRTLLDRTAEAGELHCSFDASALPSGTYLLSLHSGADLSARQIAIVR